MLNEADLNRIKGLLHFLNGNKPATRGEDHATGRRLQVAGTDRARGDDSTIKFEINVRNDEGDVIGRIFYKDGEYRFGVLA